MSVCAEIVVDHVESIGEETWFPRSLRVQFDDKPLERKIIYLTDFTDETSATSSSDVVFSSFDWEEDRLPSIRTTSFAKIKINGVLPIEPPAADFED